MSDACEYSYFRAGGMTHDAIIVVEGARTELAAMRKTISQRFGAYNMFYEDDNGACRIVSFGYNREEDIPAGWEKVEHGQITFRRMPPANSADAFNLQAYQGLLTRYLRRSELSFFLDIPPMPSMTLPEGYYSQRFVRKVTYNGGARAYMGARPEPDDHGHYKEGGDPLPSAQRTTQYPQIVTFLKYDGVYYVRVPNDTEGKALWTPPQSTPVSYAEMLALDDKVYRQQYGASAPRPKFGV